MTKITLPPLLAGALLAGCAATHTPGAPDFSSFVVLGEQGAATARVIGALASCPQISIDGLPRAMATRARAATIAAQRPVAEPRDAKPAAFPVLTCEAALPAGTRSAAVLGRALPVPASRLRRIVVIGDTGCRMVRRDNQFQACNDPAAFPFAAIAAAAAAWEPELVVHVGDYHYREQACPAGNAGCAGSPWGYGWDTWRDDFFGPARALLGAAPWVMARGNHESCKRAGQGYWRFLDPRPLLPRRDCNAPADDALGDYSDAYAVPLGGDAQLIVFDTANTHWRGFDRRDVRMRKYGATYRQVEALTHGAAHNIGVNHHPILSLANFGTAAAPRLSGGDQGLIDAFGAVSPGLLPPKMSAILSGHIHQWEQISFSSGHPSQFVSGISGSAQGGAPLPSPLPPDASPAPGARTENVSSWVNGFGYMTMERDGADSWDVRVWDRDGKLRNTCSLKGKKSLCEQAKIE
ncbi:metallophosphoesterase [Massilia glaciei]|nr:metallophosphoesterase [Massilia glaciei]